MSILWIQWERNVLVTNAPSNINPKIHIKKEKNISKSQRYVYQLTFTQSYCAELNSTTGKINYVQITVSHKGELWFTDVTWTKKISLGFSHSRAEKDFVKNSWAVPAVSGAGCVFNDGDHSVFAQTSPNLKKL